MESEEEENVRHQTFQNIVQPLNKHSTGFKTNTDKKNRSSVRFQTLKLEDQNQSFQMIKSSADQSQN